VYEKCHQIWCMIQTVCIDIDRCGGAEGEQKGGFYMQFDAEMLRNDLKIYAETALRVGLPCAVSDIAEIENASEAELVDIAATSGWDLGKYVSGFPAGE